MKNCISYLLILMMSLISSTWLTPTQAAQLTNPISTSTHLPTSIPLKRDAIPMQEDSTNLAVLVFLGILLAIALIAVYVGKRYQHKCGATKSPNTELKTLSSTRLTPKHSVHIVEWREQQFLIACSDQAITLLAQKPAADSTSKSKRLRCCTVLPCYSTVCDGAPSIFSIWKRNAQ